MVTIKDNTDQGETKKKINQEKISQQGMHPGMAAAIGAVVGAAGGVAVAMASQNPEIRKKAMEQFDILSKKGTDAWNRHNFPEVKKALKSTGMAATDSLKENMSDVIKEGKSSAKKITKTELK